MITSPHVLHLPSTPSYRNVTKSPLQRPKITLKLPVITATETDSTTHQHPTADAVPMQEPSAIVEEVHQ